MAKKGKNKKKELLTKGQKKVVIVMSAICAAMVVLLCVVVATVLRPESGEQVVKGEFTPPPFEEAAVTGVPEVEERLGWSELAIRDDYTVHVCGVLEADEAGDVPVWFSSDEGNGVWVKLRLLDETGDILGETGILRPGEYVEKLKLKSAPTADAPVTLLVMGYEPELYYSGGSVALSTTLSVDRDS